MMLILLGKLRKQYGLEIFHNKMWLGECQCFAISIGFGQIPIKAENIADYNFFDLVKISSLYFGPFFQPVWSG